MIALPPWAVVKPDRLAHIERVASLIAQWADADGLDQCEQNRWLAAAWLHDALRDEQPDILRDSVEPAFADWPAPLLHGPAAAARLRRDGAYDDGVLHAITYHTVGHPDLDAAGRALYLADYLEPGRHFDPVGRAVLRSRLPHEQHAVLRAVLKARMTHIISSHKKIRRETVAFWNSIAR